jgi:hypothetical protein
VDLEVLEQQIVQAAESSRGTLGTSTERCAEAIARSAQSF